MEPGFKVQSGALFRAWIGYCGSSHKVNSNSTVQKQYNFASVYSTDSILFVNSSYDNHINISIFSSKVSSGLVEIFDCTGKKLLEQNCSFSIGINKVAVHKNNIANGNYICKVVFGSGLFDSKKIIITNE
ncbi:MAG: T9SS type A sorting domain-containing protein [Bacteroidetes bacterium]|nr:T9SS type A sorting domain-containing protein [Bacteroidota bacterium]